MKKEDYKFHKDDINSDIMEQASDIATERLIKAHPDDEVTEIDPDGDGKITHFKEEYQDEFNQYYDEEYDRIAEEMGFDFTAEDGIRKSDKTGVVIGRYVNGISLNDLEYVLTPDEEYMHFANIDEAKQFLKDNGVEDEDELEDCFVYQYHTFCLNCGKEHFLSIDEEASADELSKGYYCDACNQST